MKSYKLRQQYQVLVDEFIAQARAAGAVVKTSNDSIKIGNATNGKVEVSGIFYLHEWPYSATSSKATKKLDILVRTSEIYEENSLTLIKSVIQVMYFDSHSPDANPSLGLHYDYEYKIGAAHPIFHAQFGSSSFSQAELASVSFERAITPWQDMVRIRIPTVHVGFPAAILSFFADHLSHQAFGTFLNWAKNNVLYRDTRTRIDCRTAPLGGTDSVVFQSQHLYA